YILFYPTRIAADQKPIVATSTPVVIQTDPIFERIALCESKNNPHIKNPYSSASGRFQFLWGTWNHYGKEFWGEDFYEKNIFNYKDNTDLAWYVYKKYGTGDWNASAYCWKQ